jgi:hypothetical protein
MIGGLPPSPYVTSTLTRGWVCRLHLLLALASAVILESESRGSHEHILLSQLRDSPRSTYLYPPRTGCPSFNPRHWVPFSSPPTTRRAIVEYSNTLPYSWNGRKDKVRIRVTLRLTLYRQSVRLGAQPLETYDQYFFN